MDIDLGADEPLRPKPPGRRRKSWLVPCLGIMGHGILVVAALAYYGVLQIPGLRFKDRPGAAAVEGIQAVAANQPRPAIPREIRPPSNPSIRARKPDLPTDSASQPTAPPVAPKGEAEGKQAAEHPQPAAPVRYSPVIESLRSEYAGKKADYEATKADAKRVVLVAIDQCETQVRNSRNVVGVVKHDLLMQIAMERERFRAGGTLPNTGLLAKSVIAYQRKIYSKRRPLLIRGEKLIEAYSREHLDGEARMLRAQIAGFEEEEGMTHRFRVDEVWDGERWFADKPPIGLRIRITKRTGDAFSAELIFAGGQAVALMEGLCDGIDIRWRTVAMLKDQKHPRNWMGTGVIAGNMLYSEFTGTYGDLDANTVSPPTDGIMILKNGN